MIWLRSLPKRPRGERGYVAEMVELTGLPQEECSRAAAGEIRAWRVKRLDEVADHRATTVPKLIWEIYEVSERKVAPTREFRLPDEAVLEYIESMRQHTVRTPRQVHEAVLQFAYVHRMGLGDLAHEMVRALMARGPERATGEIAQRINDFLDADTPAQARRRQRLMKQFIRELERLV